MSIPESLTCPVTGQEILPGQGRAVQDSKGNTWIVHKDVNHGVRTDSSTGPATVNGHPPLFGPDA